MTNELKLDAEQICYRAKGKIGNFLKPHIEGCELKKDEGGQYFVFRFTKWDVYSSRGLLEIGRFTVLGAAIEDGIMSERQLHAALWHTLGQIRGMV
jgi:hypothetical protein